MSDRLRKVKEELLVTHVPSEKNKAGRLDRGNPGDPHNLAIDQESLRRELAQATTEEQRRSILESIRERFGNELVEQIVDELREARSFEEAEAEAEGENG
jgi:protoporphyrinogen oxidase